MIYLRPREYSGTCNLCSWHFEAVVSCHITIYHSCSWLCRENIYNSSKFCVTPQNYSVIPRGHSAMHHTGGGGPAVFWSRDLLQLQTHTIFIQSLHYGMSSAEHKHNAHWATPFLSMGRRIIIFVQKILVTSTNKKFYYTKIFFV